jgi:hypothetical protein
MLSPPKRSAPSASAFRASSDCSGVSFNFILGVET